MRIVLRESLFFFTKNLTLDHSTTVEGSQEDGRQTSSKFSQRSMTPPFFSIRYFASWINWLSMVFCETPFCAANFVSCLWVAGAIRSRNPTDPCEGTGLGPLAVFFLTGATPFFTGAFAFFVAAPLTTLLVFFFGIIILWLGVKWEKMILTTVWNIPPQ